LSQQKICVSALATTVDVTPRPGQCHSPSNHLVHVTALGFVVWFLRWDSWSSDAPPIRSSCHFPVSDWPTKHLRNRRQIVSDDYFRVRNNTPTITPLGWPTTWATCGADSYCRRESMPGRRLACSSGWSRLVRLVKHARYYWPSLAEGHLHRHLFGQMLRRIWALPVPSG
jgi:hypothetical protein